MKHTPLVMVLAVLAGSPAFAETPQPAHTAHVTRHHVSHAKRQAAIAPLTAPNPPPQPVSLGNNAPVPNEGVTAPIDNSDQTTSFAPAVMQIHYPPMGNGYTTGSSAQAMDDREAAKVTGLQVKVPLGQ